MVLRANGVKCSGTGLGLGLVSAPWHVSWHAPGPYGIPPAHSILHQIIIILVTAGCLMALIANN